MFRHLEQGLVDNMVFWLGNLWCCVLRRRWQRLENVVTVSDPVHDVAFAPNLGRWVFEPSPCVLPVHCLMCFWGHSKIMYMNLACICAFICVFGFTCYSLFLAQLLIASWCLWTCWIILVGNLSLETRPEKPDCVDFVRFPGFLVYSLLIPSQPLTYSSILLPARPKIAVCESCVAYFFGRAGSIGSLQCCEELALLQACGILSFLFLWINEINCSVFLFVCGHCSSSCPGRSTHLQWLLKMSVFSLWHRRKYCEIATMVSSFCLFFLHLSLCSYAHSLYLGSQMGSSSFCPVYVLFISAFSCIFFFHFPSHSVSRVLVSCPGVMRPRPTPSWRCGSLLSLRMALLRYDTHVVSSRCCCCCYCCSCCPYSPVPMWKMDVYLYRIWKPSHLMWWVCSVPQTVSKGYVIVPWVIVSPFLTM